MPNTLLKNPVSMNAPSTSVALHVTGTPAEPSTSTGFRPANTLTVDGTAGQETTGTTGQIAGEGAHVKITAGAGGVAPTGSTNGVGGSVTIDAGAPGGGAGTAAFYGNVLLATTGGNVGIGTTTTDLQGGNRHAKYLTLCGDGALGSADGRLELANPKSPLAAGDTVGRATFLAPNNTGATNTSALGQIATQAVGSGGANGLGGRLLFYTKPDNVVDMSAGVSIDQNGAVMIANASALIAPFSSKLVVKGSTSNSSASALNVTNDGAGSLLFVRNDGNVGVGSNTPGSRLHVNGGMQVGAPTGGDKGTGSINIAGDIYKNGTPMLAKLEKAYAQIIELTKRIERLERAPKPGKPVKSKSATTSKSVKVKPAKSSKSGKSRKERR